MVSPHTAHDISSMVLVLDYTLRHFFKLLLKLAQQGGSFSASFLLLSLVLFRFPLTV